MDPAPPPTGKAKYAWREVEVVGLPEGSPEKRVADFHEIYFLYDEATVRAQASRCLLCPEASCVTCCPLHNRIPDWMALAADGDFLGAAEVSRATSNEPDFCSRVCPQERVCESACILSGRSDPVCIGAVERFISEYALAAGAHQVTPPPSSGLSAAVVGTGPGCLACADDLARRGYSVTLFESSWLPGGLLMNGIPALQLDRAVVGRRLDLLRRRGVKVRLDVSIGKDLPLQHLLAEFDAVFLAAGTLQARPLAIAGAALKHVHHALLFLIQHNVAVRLELPPIEVAAKRVVALGGGDAALQCLRTALRAGAKEAICVYRRDQACLPASQEEYAAAIEERAQFRFLAAPVALDGDANGNVTGVRCLKTELCQPDADGRPALRIVPGSEFSVPADVVLFAYGYEPAPVPLQGELSAIAVDQNAHVIVDENQMTNVPRIFAGAGDSRGPSLLVDVVRAGRKAAKGIDRYLTAKKSGRA